MATSPLLGGERAPQRPEGTGTDRLGPSDISDSGSDIVGADAELGDANFDSDSDHFGTGERAAAGRDNLRREGADILPDHVEGGPGSEDVADLGGDIGDVDEDIEGGDGDESERGASGGREARPGAGDRERR